MWYKLFSFNVEYFRLKYDEKGNVSKKYSFFNYVCTLYVCTDIYLPHRGHKKHENGYEKGKERF